MIFLRNVVILASANIIVGAIWAAFIFTMSDLGSTDHYQVLLILGGVLLIALNSGFYKYFSEKITRFLCFGLIFISVCYCYQNDSEWPYAQLLIHHHRNNYTKEWYCKLTYRDKLLIEAYTTHGIEDCRQ